MRSLTLNESLNVNGAGYVEDITATAATLYVGSSLYGVGLGFAKGFVACTTSMVGLAPLTAVLTPLVPVLALSVPAAAAAVVLSANPDYETALSDKFHAYFG
ncbi:MAG: hypothetical protein AB7V32_07090 [Candidatus Berkiella sp.]